MANTVVAPANTQTPEWEVARRLYPLYWAVCSRFNLGEPCAAIERGEATPEAVAAANAWLNELDARIEPHHLRQVLQTTNFSTEPVLRDLITRTLERRVALGYDGAKLDFLLVQYFATVAPAELFSRDISLEEVSEILEPVLGETSTMIPKWLEPLDEIIDALRGCTRLSQLLEGKLVERARALKHSAGEMSYGSVALLAFTRFNFHARNTFFRVLQQEIREISRALDKLQGQGTTRIDGRAAGLSENESTATLRQWLWEWKRPARAAYSEVQVLEQLAQIRGITDALIAPPPKIEEQVKLEAQPEAALVAAPAAPVLEESEPPAKDEAQAGGGGSAGDALQACLEQIAESLLANPRAMASTSFELKGTKVSIAPWEIAAFVRGGDEVSDVLQRAVAARALLMCARREQRSDLRALIAAARTEAEQVQTAAALAKQTKNIDAAVNLAATGKRLLAAIDEAEKSAGAAAGATR